MNDTNIENDSIVTEGAIPDEEQRDITMPLGTSEFGSDNGSLPGLDPLSGGAARKRLSGTAILIPAVICIAVGGLFLMNRVARVAAGTGLGGEYETTVTEFLNRFQDTADPEDGISTVTLTLNDNQDLAVLDESYHEYQVPLQDVQRDPFVIYHPTVTSPDEPDDPGAQAGDDAVKLWQQQRAARQTAIEHAGTLMRLKSVLGGSNPLAIINDKVVRFGEEIQTADENITFRVQAINTASVDLLAEVPHLDLSVTVTIYIDRD